MLLKTSMMQKIDDCSELRDLLQNPTVLGSSDKHKKVVRRVINLMCHGVDMGPLLPDMIKALACPDLIMKKLVYHYISVYAYHQPDLTLLVVNTLVKQCFEPNPMLRAWALNTLCSLRLVGLCEYIKLPLQRSLQDNSPYVRAVGALCCAKIHQLDPSIISDLNLDEVLLNLTQDKDPTVTVNSILSLGEILSDSGGVNITQSLAHQLFNRLSTFSEAGLVNILQFLEGYQPSDDDDIFNMLNILDPYLKHCNTAVVMVVARLFLKLTQHIADIHTDVHAQITSRVLSLCETSTSCPELQYLLLCHIRLLAQNCPSLLDTHTIHYTHFFTNFNDPSYVKEVKLYLLTMCCDDDNVTEIVDELCMYVTDSTLSLSTQAITALCNIAVKHTSTNTQQLCFTKLLQLLNISIDHIVSTTLTVLQVLLLRHPHYSSEVVECLHTLPYTHLDVGGRSAFLWILGQYGQGSEECVYLIENIIDEVHSETDYTVCIHLLTASVKLFFNCAPQCQQMLGRVLEYLLGKDNDMCVRGRALFYYQLLSTSLSKASKVITGDSVDNSETVCSGSSQSLCSSFNNTSFLLSNSDNSNSTAVAYSADTAITSFNNIYTHHFEEQSADNDSGELLLVHDFNLTPEQFESQWISWPVSKNMALKPTTSTWQLTGIECGLSALNIHTMAISPSGSEQWKAYLYAKDIKGFVYILQLVMNGERSECECVIKSASATDNSIQQFSTLLSQTLL